MGRKCALPLIPCPTERSARRLPRAAGAGSADQDRAHAVLGLAGSSRGARASTGLFGLPMPARRQRVQCYMGV